MYHQSRFSRFAKWIAHKAGHPLTFGIAVALILGWAVSGPLFGFSETWQLVINTSTTVVTFLMVFLIQNTQNRESTVVQIKLDEIIHALAGARDTLLDLEELKESDIDELHETFEGLAREARKGHDEPSPP